MRDLLPEYNEQEQYQIGLEAGRDLAKMHLHPAPGTIQSWYIRSIKKHNAYVDAYKTCGIIIKNDD